MSIRLKIILILIAFIVIPAVLFSVLSYSSARRALYDVRIAQLNNIAVLKKERIETFFNAWKADIGSVQHNPDIRRYFPVLIGHGSGRHKASTAEALGEIEEQVRELVVDYGYLSVALTDDRGNIVYGIPGGRNAGPRRVPAGAEFFQQARKSVYFSDVYRRTSDGRIAIIGAAPVHDGNGAFIGEIVIEHDMAPLYRFISDSTGLGSTGEVVISRRDGDSVLFLSPLKHDPDAALTKRVSFSGNLAYPSQMAARGETGSGIATDYSGAEVLAAWQYIPYLRWGLVTKIDTSEALGPVFRLRSLILLATVIILSLGVLVAVATAKSVSEPILDLQKGTAVIGRGDLDHKVGTAAKDEVGELSRLIDSMSINLKKVMASRDDLNAEIEVRRRTEDAVSRLNRLYAVLSKVNETIVRVDEPKELYEQICRIAVEEGSFKMAWIGLVDPLTQRVRPVVSCGDDGGYLDGLGISAADVPEGRGPTGTAIRENRQVICGDIEQEPRMLPWRDRALRSGFRSSAAFPLRTGAGVAGAITLYAAQPEFFTEEETVLLSSLADDVSFAMTSLANEEQRRAEAERSDLTNELLQRFSRNVTRKEYLDDVCELVRSWSGFRHVGIRIVGSHGKVPFESCSGYSSSFLETEGELSMTDAPCICARIIRGAPEPADRRSMTPYGSFYSGNTATFVEGLREEERRWYRGVCMKHGYTSLMVIPIRYRDSPLGALHLADERADMVPPGNVEFLEHLAFIIGEAVYRFGIEDELRRNYEALQASEARYRTLVEDVRDVIFTVGTDGMVMSLSPAFRELTGLPTEDSVGKHFSSFIHPDDVSYAGEVFNSILAGHPVPLFEIRVRTASGDYRHFEFKITAGRTADGRILGTGRDVTERKQAEEERSRLVSAIEAAADAVVITDPSTGVIVYLNPAFERLTGYAREEVMGRTLHFLDSGEHDARFYTGLREALAQTGVWSGKLTSRKKDGSLYFEECAVSPVRNGNGHIINYVYIKRDVTEKMRLESIAESVSMMDNIGAVFSGVRHEIGNPVNSINMILGILRAKIDSLPPEAVKDYLGRMAEQVSRIGYILRSLKSFNLYESQSPQLLPLEPFMENFLQLVQDDMAMKGIALKASVEPGLAATADPRALQQVLLNIVTNAADALNGREGPTIDVRAGRAKDRVRIRVKDNGIGITEESMKNVFKPFYTTKTNGTGLGLVIVKKMLTGMRGTVEVASREGKGTTVEILIPRGAA